MNRYLLLVVGALLGAACDDRMKSPEPMNSRPTERTNVPASTEARVEGQQAAADNTKKNVRDRDDTLTPMDQGNSTAETAITASIRKAVMAEDSLSVTAKNVKVITTGSHVTLRGPVASAEEKALIATLATGTTGVSNIDNQLEVKP
jgi:osmotically-inducible protein OsmY